MNTNLESRLAELDLPVPSGLAERALRAAAAPEVVAVPSRYRVGSRRFALGGVTMAVILATLALAAVVDGSGHVPTANADEILSKAQRAATEASFSYHLVQTTTEFGAFEKVQTSEFWYQDADHIRGEHRSVADGKPTVDGAVWNKGDFWGYGLQAGITTAMHSPPGGRWNFGTPSLGNGIGETLAAYGGPESCRSATLAPDQTVLGRTAYVVRVTPAPAACTRTDSMKTWAKSAAAAGDSDIYWFDSTLFVVLRSEHYSGAVLAARTEVSVLETHIEFPESIFVYAPPPGAVVREATDPALHDAHAILASVRAAAAAPKQPFHAVVKSGTPEQTYQTDMWYADETHARSEEREYRAGKLFSTFGVSRKGNELWQYIIDQEKTDIVHLTNQPENPLPTVFGGNPWLTHSGEDGVTLLLRSALSSCRAVVRGADEIVNGRPTFVVTVESGAPGCKDPGVTPAGGAREPDASVARTNWTLWFDQETYFPLKQESRFLSGAPVRPEWKWEVTVFEVGPVDPAAFDYQPPAGVNVKEVVGTP